MRSKPFSAFYAIALCLPSLVDAQGENQGTKNKFDEAKIIFDQVAQMILPDGKYRADNYSRGDTLKNVKSKGVSPDFAALMLPADDSHYELRRRYAIVMAELEPPSKYLPLIDKLVMEHPGDHDLTAIQLIAAPPSRRRALIQAMARDPHNDLSALEQRLPKLLDADSPLDAGAYRSMLDNWLMVADLFNAFPHGQSPEKYIHSYQLSRLLFSDSADNIGVPSFLPSHSSPPPTAELEELATQRNKTIYTVAMAMHGNPAATREAFAILHHGRDVFHLSEARLRRLALQSCQLILRDEDRICHEDSYEIGIFVNLRPSRFSEIRLDRAMGFDGVTPYGYLLDLATKNRQYHTPAEFLECFSEGNRKTLEAGLGFFSNPTEAQAKKMLPAWVAEDEPIPAAELSLPVALAGLCGIDTNKGFITLLDATKTSEAPHLYHQQIEILALWANVNLEHRNITQLAATIQLARQLFKGMPVSSDTLSETGAIGAVFHRIHCPPDECALIRVSLAAYFAEPRYNYAVAPRLELPESPAESASILIASHLFHTGPGMFSQGSDMISSSDDMGFLPFAVMGYRPKGEGSESDDLANRELGRELLKTVGPERFWARITGAYLAKQDAAIVVVELERELPAIKTWPEPEQHSLAKFLLAQWPTLQETESLTAWFKQAALMKPKQSKDD